MSRRFITSLRTSLIALVAIFGVASAAKADSGSIRLEVVKAGWVIGATGGSGVLVFRGRTYPLSVGGLDFGLIFGGPVTRLTGTVTNIRSPADVAGVYAAGGAGLALGPGVRAIVLSNPKGAVLRLSGGQVGLMANLDLSGLAIALK